MSTAFTIIKCTAFGYLCLCVLLYFIQERLIFFPKKLPPDYVFPSNQKFEELAFATKDNNILHGLLFRAKEAKGLIFYLHGNAGSLQSWSSIASTYTDLHYDLFMLDYRGYGKSSGSISSEKQVFEDVQLVYNAVKKNYAEKDIIVLGYSIGTGPAAKLASTNLPRLLILQAPYYSLIDMMKHSFPFIPSMLLKYRFETNKYVKNCRMPVVIFHGTKDEVIYYGSALKLQALFKPADTLITLDGQGHNGMSDNSSYRNELSKILKNGF